VSGAVRLVLTTATETRTCFSKVPRINQQGANSVNTLNDDAARKIAAIHHLPGLRLAMEVIARTIAEQEAIVKSPKRRGRPRKNDRNTLYQVLADESVSA